MSELDDWQKKTEEWSNAIKKARAQRAVIDDKMTPYLNGTNRLPTIQELIKVENLWELHVATRRATNEYILEKIKLQVIQK